MRSTFGPVAWGIARMTAVICPGRFEGTICCVIPKASRRERAKRDGRPRPRDAPGARTGLKRLGSSFSRKFPGNVHGREDQVHPCTNLRSGLGVAAFVGLRWTTWESGAAPAAARAAPGDTASFALRRGLIGEAAHHDGDQRVDVRALR